MKATITIPKEIKDAAQTQCVANYETLSGYIRRLIMEDLKKNKGVK